jgi:hypothetical protein
MVALYTIWYNQTLRAIARSGCGHQRHAWSMTRSGGHDRCGAAKAGQVGAQKANFYASIEKLLLLAAAISLTASAQAAEKEQDAAVELEIGAAVEWGLPGGGFSFGPSAGIEFTPIKHWLEIEAGISPVFGGGRTEWGTELVFKKPYELSDKVEMMVGLGPEWLYKTGGGAQTASSIGGVAIVDFQIWPFPERKFGWFIEPSYGYDFGRGHEQSLGVTVGLLIPIR